MEILLKMVGDIFRRLRVEYKSKWMTNLWNRRGWSWKHLIEFIFKSFIDNFLCMIHVIFWYTNGLSILFRWIAYYSSTSHLIFLQLSQYIFLIIKHICCALYQSVVAVDAYSNTFLIKITYNKNENRKT